MIIRSNTLLHKNIETTYLTVIEDTTLHKKHYYIYTKYNIIKHIKFWDETNYIHPLYLIYQITHVRLWFHRILQLPSLICNKCEFSNIPRVIHLVIIIYSFFIIIFQHMNKIVPIDQYSKMTTSVHPNYKQIRNTDTNTANASSLPGNQTHMIHCIHFSIYSRKRNLAHYQLVNREKVNETYQFVPDKLTYKITWTKLT